MPKRDETVAGYVQPNRERRPRLIPKQQKRARPLLSRTDVRPSRAFGSGVRVRWTAEETELLVKLVGEYGKKWSKIYDTSPSFWMRNGRSQVDLKDKFRNLAKKQRI